MLEVKECPYCKSQSLNLLYWTVDIKVSHLWFKIVKCNNCGYVFTNPRPSKDEISLYYPDEYYAYKPYKSTCKKNETYNTKNNATRSKILDVGCGSGNWLYKQKMSQNEVYGVELNPKAVAIAKKRDINIFCGKFEDTEYPNENFDLVRFNHVLEHMYDPLKAIKEVRRILKKHGCCIIVVPNFDSSESKSLKGAWRHLDVPRHLSHFSPGFLEKIIKLSGLEIENKHFYHFPNRISDIGPYIRCQFTTLKLIFYILKFEKRQKTLFVVLISMFRFLEYFSKYWFLRVIKKIKPCNGNAVFYTCVKN